MRKVFLESLPRWGNGRYKGEINWKECIDCKVNFIYDDIEGEVEIVDFISKGQNIYIKYLDKDVFRTKVGSFKDCAFGKLLGRITGEFKIEIGQIFKDEKRDLIVIDREYRNRVDINNNKYKDKWYKYICNICGWTDGWIEESSLLRGGRCGCCCNPPKVVVEHINSIVANDETHWMVKYFQDGYDEAKLYTAQSNRNIYPICPDCGIIKDKEMQISDIYNMKSIGCSCSDGKSYPEKFMLKVLEQLNVKFEIQLSKSIYKWCQEYKYDFYFELNNKNYIIETHGIQHYSKSFYSNKKGRSLDKEKENDKLKKELALKNINEYIIIDCRISDLEFIKSNILKSELNNIFDLTKIDWLKCHEFALCNLVKIVCNYKKLNPDLSTVDIGKIMKLGASTVKKYLKSGSQLGWCFYDAKKERSNAGKKRKGENNHMSRKVICLNTLEVFNTGIDASKKYNINNNNICLCCQGKRNWAGIYINTEEKLKWMYYENYLNNPTMATVEYKSKFICVNTKEIFSSTAKAGEKYNIKSSNHIYECCQSKRRYCGIHPITNEELKWEYYSNVFG